jgi:hypothetical protein
MNKTFLISTVIASASLLMSACTSGSQENQTIQTTPVEQDTAVSSTVVQQDTIKKSIPSQAEGSIGNTNVKINYYAPGVKGRMIWGGLVAYDQVWVTGAHKATDVSFDKAVLIDGKEVPAGMYALFTIPGKQEWTIILNKDYKQHLADDYDQKKDIIRVKVKPEKLDQHQERLKYDIVEGTDNKGAITISWEKVKVTLPVAST